ncbi:MAG: S1 RNA-binding domain-containing protein, partial [Bdellovibrionales bacterium]|nr:S1 RNA-binding domain-containing protein [Bdellovibrionales bacterium]
GKEVEVEVTNVDRDERRISLSIKAITQREQKESMAEFMQDEGAAVTFGDLLREKMDSGSDS